MIAEQVKLVDAVCEIIDARIPISSRNPDLDELTGDKPRLVIMNRTDQADPEATKRWSAYYRARGLAVLETDAKSGKGTSEFVSAVRTLLKEKIKAYEAKGQAGRVLRLMVVGIPNVGKSSFINRIAGRRAAEASDRPGVTRGRQWITIGAGLELLDTPGILWPKFESQTVGENLAFTGAVKDDILDREGLAANLMAILRETSPQKLAERYKIELPAEKSGYDLLGAAAKKRGFLLPGGVPDTERMAAVLLDEFRGGKLGRITLERPGTETAGGE
ncbi:ribosome biogenesis GTPase A [Sporobacter termitidis DSM 10068]|uniref:Ribosome biogenesis GTPase A n=2 Tax=Sporobacter TaxID=44748 RepID=A0A1M5TL60_9FIRM|nr:ribosome biogenesis GTPase A [Sporobacter termitidis DSM 10068]